MNSIEEKLDIITNLLIRKTPNDKSSGLLNGKMGCCIYFSHLARQTGNPDHKEFADKLIDEVYTNVGKEHQVMNFENGLAGIAWGIEHLVQNGFVEADTDAILRDVDDKIYKSIIFTKDGLVSPSDTAPGINRGTLGYTLYVLARLNGKDLHNTNDVSTTIFIRLLIILINRLGRSVEEKKIGFQEPLLFNITWDLPIYLILLGELWTMDFYNYKIDRILELLSPIILSLFPHSPGNRFYLLLGLESVLKHVDISGWSDHAKLLKQNIRLSEILYKDLKNKHVHLIDGVAGISLISRRYYQITQDDTLLFNHDDLIGRITTSDFWKVIEKDKPDSYSVGLLYGLSGIGMELLNLNKSQMANVNES